MSGRSPEVSRHRAIVLLASRPEPQRVNRHGESRQPDHRSLSFPATLRSRLIGLATASVAVELLNLVRLRRTPAGIPLAP